MSPATEAPPPLSSGFDGTHQNGGGPYNVNARYRPGVTGPTGLSSIILRVVVVITAFIAAVVMGVTKQTRRVLLGNGDIIDLKLQTTGASQLDFFIAANVIACVYSMISLALFFMNKGSVKNIGLVVIIIDIVMVGFLFSAIGSASAVAVLLRKGGNIWPRVCHVFNNFCAGLAGAIVMSMFGGLAFIALVMFAIIRLHQP